MKNFTRKYIVVDYINRFQSQKFTIFYMRKNLLFLLDEKIVFFINEPNKVHCILLEIQITSE